MIPKELVGLAPLAVAPAPSPLHLRQSVRVLVVDDEMIHRLWKLTPKRLGLAVVLAFKSLEDCEAAGLDYSCFALCFIDLHMPVTVHELWDIDDCELVPTGYSCLLPSARPAPA